MSVTQPTSLFVSCFRFAVHAEMCDYQKLFFVPYFTCGDMDQICYTGPSDALFPDQNCDQEGQYDQLRNTYFVTTQSHAKIDMLCTTILYQLLHRTFTVLNVIVFCHMTAIMCSTSFEFWQY